MKHDASVERALREYKRVHWGIEGPRGAVSTRVPDPFLKDDPVPVVLGHLVKVVYCTEKGGDGELVDYDHDFDPKNSPILCFNRSGLIICGGGYRVGIRGIVG